MVDVTSRCGPLRLVTPVIAASGCAGFGAELARVSGMDFARLGALVTPSISREPTPGLPPPRAHNADGGMLWATGLPGAGVEAVLEHEVPRLRELSELHCPVIASIVGEDQNDTAAVAERLEAAGSAFAAVELNAAGLDHDASGTPRRVEPPFARDPVALRELVSAVVAACTRPVFVKLPIDTGDTVALAFAASQGGAAGLTVGYPPRAMAVNWQRGESLLARHVTRLSGPAIRPLMLRVIDRVHAALPDVPLIASGGAQTASDVLEYLAAGARAVQVGTAALVSPLRLLQLTDELAVLMKANGFSSLAALPRVGGTQRRG